LVIRESRSCCCSRRVASVQFCSFLTREIEVGWGLELGERVKWLRYLFSVNNGVAYTFIVLVARGARARGRSTRQTRQTRHKLV